MSTKTKSAPAYQPGTLYRVRLAGVVTLGRRTLTPMHQYEIDGAVLADLPAEKIKSAEKVS